MSDYGSAVRVKSTNNLPFSAKQIAELKNAANQISLSGKHQSILVEDDLCFEWIKYDKEDLILKISEFWYGEGDDEEMFEFAKDHDLELALEIAKDMKEKLNKDYSIKGVFMDWEEGESPFPPHFRNASEEQKEITFKALEHALESVKPGGPLIPFVMSKENGELKLHRFMGEHLEEAQKKAKNFLNNIGNSIEIGVLAYDGYTTNNDKREDAILVETYKHNEDNGYVLAQAYRPKKGFFSKFKTLDLHYLGTVPNILTVSITE